MANSNEMSSRTRRLRRLQASSARRSAAACPAPVSSARILADARRISTETRAMRVADARRRLADPGFDLDREFQTAMRILISREL